MYSFLQMHYSIVLIDSNHNRAITTVHQKMSLQQTGPESGPPRKFARGSVRMSCRYWPLMSSHWLIFRVSTPNSRHVWRNAGRQSSRLPWSTVGSRWCRPWDPNDTSARNSEPSTTVLPRTASSCAKPQSMSSLSFRGLIIIGFGFWD